MMPPNAMLIKIEVTNKPVRIGVVKNPMQSKAFEKRLFFKPNG